MYSVSPGNIRVYCRVRPLLPSEGGSQDCTEGCASQPSVEICYPDEEKAATKAITLQSSSVRSHQFQFDQVFGPSSSQADVFNDISELVQSTFDGYNTCIFAYGHCSLLLQTLTCENNYGLTILRSYYKKRDWNILLTATVQWI